MTVQFVVGATPDTDKTLIDTVARLKTGGGIHHTHFSAFRPIVDTPMEDVPAAPALREHRLYQADYLLHDYGFTADEVVYEPSGNLPLSVDPKTAWALAHPERFPVEVTRADYDELVRVPGIGPLERPTPGGRAADPHAPKPSRPARARRGHDASGGVSHAAWPSAADHALDRAARLLGAGRRSRAASSDLRGESGTFR